MSVSLRSLSDKDILSRTLELTRRERSVTLQVLLHSMKSSDASCISRRDTRRCSITAPMPWDTPSPAAVRRIQAARCVARFPEIYALLEANEVNLSTISQISRVLKHDNKDVILARIRGKSHREVKAIAAGYQPRALPPDEVRPIAVFVPASASGAPAVNATGPAPSVAVSGACENSNYIRCGCAPDARAEGPACAGEAGDAAAIVETRKVFKFTATDAFEKKFERIKSLAWHRLGPNPAFEQVFELAMDCFLEKEDPIARRERREKRGGRARAARTQDRGARYIPAATRDRVFVRDQGRCCYESPDGRRCSSTTALQIDHVTPVARGGANTTDNLRLLCAYHNRLEAERLMGPAARRNGAP